MTVNYDAATKTDRMNAVIDRVDGAATNATLEICSAAYAAVLATFNLPKPSFSESAGVITLLGVPLDTTGSAGGNAALARIKDGDGNIRISGLTVGQVGTDVILNEIDIAVGQPVRITAGTITHP